MKLSDRSVFFKRSDSKRIITVSKREEGQ